MTFFAARERAALVSSVSVHDGRFAYLLFELSNEVKVYSYDGSGKNPEFQLLQSITTLGKEDANDAIHNAASGMSLSADGKYLFCTTAGENTVTMYAVDAGNRPSDQEIYTSDQW